MSNGGVRRLVETICFLVLVVVVSLRPLVAETYDSAAPAISAAIGELDDPTPVRTLVFNIVVLACCCGWLATRAIGSTGRFRRTGLEIGAGIIALAVVISCLGAGNKRLAINASIDWLCYPLLTIVLVQLTRDGLRRRILLAAVLASAGAQAVKCFEQHFVEFPETKSYYESKKAEIWAAQGVPLESAQVELFEHRMAAGEAGGSFAHSNVAASYLVLCGLAALGASAESIRRGRDMPGRVMAVGCSTVTLLICSAVFLTGSRGALISGAAGLIVWGAASFARSWIESHRRGAFLLGGSAVLAGAIGTVGYGLYHQSLPGVSLNFRWQYWTASLKMFVDHLWTGVGRENFGRHYVQYKPIENPEEIANPHNLFVQAGVDWGVIGLVGVVLMIVCGAWVVTREAKHHSSGSAHPTKPILAGVVILAALLIWRVPLFGTDNPDFVFLATVMTGVPWLLCYLIFFHVAPGVEGGLNGPHGASKLVPATLAGLFAFLLHDMINFALFVPGSATTFFGLLAFCIAGRGDGQPTPPGRKAALGEEGHFVNRLRTWLPLTLCGFLTGAVIVVFFAPAYRATYHLDAAKRLSSQRAPGGLLDLPAESRFQAAANADPLDPTPCMARAQWLVAMSGVPEFADEALSQAVKSLELASQRDPFSLSPHRARQRVFQQLAIQTGNAQYFLASIEAAKRVLELYPLDPPNLVALADCQLQAGEALGSVERFRAAAESFRRALQLDDSRPAFEKIRRFRDWERTEIKNKIVRAEAGTPPRP